MGRAKNGPSGDRISRRTDHRSSLLALSLLSQFGPCVLRRMHCADWLRGPRLTAASCTPASVPMFMPLSMFMVSSSTCNIVRSGEQSPCEACTNTARG
jgi:hypothetical protein